MIEEKLEIFVNRQHNGTLLDTVHGGLYIKKLYQGYTLQEAKQDFRQYVKDQLKLDPFLE